MNAWPSLQTHLYDGWVLRFAAGVPTRRVNSVNPIYHSSLPIDQKIAYCEQLYQSRYQRNVFKLTTTVFPDNLDSILAGKGYQKEAETSVQTLSLHTFSVPPASNSIQISESISEGWLTQFMRLNEAIPTQFDTYWKMLHQIQTPVCLLSLVEKGQPVACGLGVADGDFVGLFDIVVAAPLRNRGLGYAVVASILEWGKSKNAKKAYLQVMCKNAPALHLYQKIGFSEEYRYWYRVK